MNKLWIKKLAKQHNMTEQQVLAWLISTGYV